MQMNVDYDDLKMYSIKPRATTNITKQRANRPTEKIKLNVRKHSTQRKHEKSYNGTKIEQLK